MAAFMITYVRLFPSMSLRVNCQCTALDKTFITALNSAVMMSLIGMYPIVSTEIWFAMERLMTKILFSVSPHLQRFLMLTKIRSKSPFRNDPKDS